MAAAASLPQCGGNKKRGGMRVTRKIDHSEPIGLLTTTEIEDKIVDSLNDPTLTVLEQARQIESYIKLGGSSTGFSDSLPSDANCPRRQGDYVAEDIEYHAAASAWSKLHDDRKFPSYVRFEYGIYEDGQKVAGQGRAQALFLLLRELRWQMFRNSTFADRLRLYVLKRMLEPKLTTFVCGNKVMSSESKPERGAALEKVASERDDSQPGIALDTKTNPVVAAVAKALRIHEPYTERDKDFTEFNTHEYNFVCAWYCALEDEMEELHRLMYALYPVLMAWCDEPLWPKFFIPPVDPYALVYPLPLSRFIRPQL